MRRNKKQAIARLRQPVSRNFKEEFKVRACYDICLAKAETSLLTVNK